MFLKISEVVFILTSFAFISLSWYLSCRAPKGKLASITSTVAARAASEARPRLAYSIASASPTCIGTNHRSCMYQLKCSTLSASTLIRLMISSLVLPCLARLDRESPFW
ncbi:ABC transporter C family member 3-like [Iris pallida]|uniref:ABC transporter C family member 3-like n=1 Tax=Iris pallida TaxID=29817 RepID=A0AAX6HWK3_IRIPA|nr:ABC transporter C family member 3-like [Iris pallida]